MDTNAPGGSYTPPPPPPPGGGGGTGPGELVYPTQPPKDPILVAVLSLLLGGVGHIIMGQKTKGIVLIAAWVVLGIVTCGIGAGVVGILGAVDGYMQAEQLKAGHPVGQWTFFNDHR